ncbi:hypothetical protein [Paenibacillus tengchongensis]|uniref:hypothetical protein n=1 Tax=Paenibacillus tengchongensis TaxID=2608684 RepID=UPI00124E1794|nr:hypothetical protein [Paenibacillus tengchongensis]
MLSILFYYHRYYLRSYRYTAPLTVFLIAMFFLYGVVPNPVMDSYAASATLLFLIAAWLCYGFVDLEDDTQQVITFLHSGKLALLYTAKLIYVWLFTVPLSVFAIVYPIIFDKFAYTPSLRQALTALGCHQLAALLGITLAAWFNAKLFRTGLISFLSLCTVLAVALGGQGIINRTFPAMSWVIPPYPAIMYVLNDHPQAELAAPPQGIWYLALYIIMLAVSYLWVMSRRKFDERLK